MEERILDLLKRRDYTPQNADELRACLGLRHDRLRELEQLLARLERSGQIARIKAGNRYALPITADLVPGRIRMNRAGVGFVQPDDPKLPTFRVAFDATGTAMHGDHVLVRRDVLPRVPRRPDASEPTARVVRVLERARTQLVGTLQRGKQFLYVIPDDPRISHDIYVPAPRDTGRPANVGDQVVVDLLEWKSRNANPEGEIVEVLGPPDAEGVDMLSVIRQYKLALHFPKQVLHEAESVGREVKPAERAGRTDCRSHQVVTIDPDDAKDFVDHVNEMLSLANERGVIYSTVLMDTWYATSQIMVRLQNEGKIFYCPIKTNRKVDDSKGINLYKAVEQLVWTEEELRCGKTIKIWKTSKHMKVKLFRVMVSSQTEYIITNDVSQVSADEALTKSSMRWKIEQLHREEKQLTGIEKCQCRTNRSQRNHILCCTLVWLFMANVAHQNSITTYQVKNNLWKEYLTQQLKYPKLVFA